MSEDSLEDFWQTHHSSKPDFAPAHHHQFSGAFHHCTLQQATVCASVLSDKN